MVQNDFKQPIDNVTTQFPPDFDLVRTGVQIKQG